MNEHQEKQRFKRAIDHTLSGMMGDPLLYQRIMTKAEKGDVKGKYAIPKRAAIALVVVLCMGTAAMAAGLYGGAINWEGEIIYDDPQRVPMPSATPRLVEGEPIQMNEEYEKALAAAEAYAYEEAECTGSMFIIYQLREDGSRKPEIEVDLSIKTTSETEFEAMMEEASWLPRPNYIPDGYAFERAEVYYTCAIDGAWELVKAETVNDCIQVEWYKPSKPVATRYFLFYRQSEEDYHYIGFYVDLMLAYEAGNASFGFSEGMTAQVITVPGMEQAIAITGERSCSLSMRRPLPEPLDVWYVSENGQFPQALEDVWIDVSAPLIDINDLIHLFATE